MQPQAEPSAVVVRLDRAVHFQHRVTNRRRAEAAVGGGKQLGFRDAGFVGDPQRLHHFAGDLVMKSLLNDKAAGRHAPAHELSSREKRAAVSHANQFTHQTRGW